MITSYFEKESFWLPKGFVLPSKRSPFTMQKDSFYNAKGVLLQGGGTTSGIFKDIYPLRYVSIIAENGCKITKLSPFLQ